MDNKQSYKQYLGDFAEYIDFISIGILALQVLTFLISFITKISLFIISIPLGLLAMVSFTILKEYAKSEKKKRLSFIIFQISFVLFLISALNDILWLFIGSLSLKLLNAMPILADAGVILVIVAMLQEPEKRMKTALNDFYYSDFETFKNRNKKVDQKPGSAILGKNTETHEPVVVPLKDRYLHFLILGPTGSGKTSQSIIPMIYRDIQWTGDDQLGLIVLEPKGDLAEKVYAMGKMFNRKVQYFNPMLKDCPYFNPLMGDETDVIENFVTTFNAFTADSSSFFRNGNEVLLRRAITVCYRVAQERYERGDSKSEYPTLLDLDTVLNNAAGKGEKMLREFMNIKVVDSRTLKEQEDIFSWFMDDYYSAPMGRVSKSYENTSDARTILTKIISNKYLRDVLCPPEEITDEVEARGFIDFRKCLAEREIITISSAEGDLRDLGKFLGYFLILSLQSSVFSRPGNENTRPGCMLYIDEFQTYSNTQFADMLTKGRSYRVACHLATQNRALIGMNSGKEAKSFTELVDTNCRNLILYPGGNPTDAKYYSDKFGEEEYVEKQVSVSRQKFNPLYGFMMRAPSTTERDVEGTRARITPSEIMYRPFGEVTCSIIQNNTLQEPCVSKIEYIPMEVNNRLDEMIAEYNSQQLNSSAFHKTTASLFDLEKDEEFKKRNLSGMDDEEEFGYEEDDDGDITMDLEIDDDVIDDLSEDFDIEDIDMPNNEDVVEESKINGIPISEIKRKYNSSSIDDDFEEEVEEEFEDEEF